MKILFFGTPQISVPFLKSLIKSHDVVGVVTQPDRRSARGQHMHLSPIKTVALENNIAVFQPEKFEDDDVSSLKRLDADVGVVVAYGKLMPERVFAIPKYNCFNVHFSLLPKYRGAAPVQWALIKGESVSGVTTFWIEKGMDSGPIIAKKSIEIGNSDNAMALSGKLIPLGVEAMNETLDLIKSGDSSGVPQMEPPTFAPSLKKEDGRIDWTKSNADIFNLIRGTNPWPGAFTEIAIGKLKGKKIKMLNVQIDDSDQNLSENTPGKIVDIVKNEGFVVNCGKGSLLVKEVHMENKKPMSAWSFIQGSHFDVGDVVFSIN